MAHSYAENDHIACPQCGQEIEAAIWLIVDAGERPDLVVQLVAGTLREVVCPACDELVGHADAPLLLFRPHHDPALIYAPAQLDPHAPADDLVAQLREAVGEGWRPGWERRVLRVYPLSLLPAALGETPQALSQAMLEQAARELARLGQERPDLYRELCTAFGRLE